ncbi:uncharacterized protein LOC119719947 [Patiria miniata]|uniref:Uncharacterized protein n=1 Tax=Patiria miniata TaxID=46514 RepID=A0A913Z0B6_PATMI|nr:uncharacterized protein LOC119719947 [Patiria miniata]
MRTMALSKMEDTGDSLVTSLQSSEGWGFEGGSSGDHSNDIRHKTGSVAFQNALHDLQREQERYNEEDESDSGIQDNPDSSAGTQPTTKKSIQETLSSHWTTGSAPHPPIAPRPKQTHRKSTTRRPDSLNVTSSQVAASHPKPKLDLSFRETASDGGFTNKSHLPKLRKSPKSLSHENVTTKPAGKVTASPATSPKLLRRKSLGVVSPSSARRRFSAYDEPMGLLSDNYTRRLQRVGAATHASVPSPSSTSRSDQSNLRRYSSVNLPPIAGATQRRHSSVIPALVSPNEPARHTGPLSSNILAHTFGGQGGRGALSMARERRVSQAVDELLHIEEVRRASEMRSLVASTQPGQAGRGSQSHDLGDMLQGLKDCRYLRGSTNEEEFV